MKVKIRNLLPFIGIALFIYVLYKANVVSVAKEIASANFYLLILAVFVTFLLTILQSYKWYVIARKQNIKVPFKEAYKINSISDLYGLVTPSKMGSVVRAQFLRRYTTNIGKGISNFVLDKCLDLSSLLFLAVFFSYIFRNEINFGSPIYYLGILIFIFLSLFFFLDKERAKWILKIIYNKFMPKKSRKAAKVTFNSFYDSMPQKRFFALFFLINIINWIGIYFSIYLMGLSVGIHLGFYYYLAILPISTLVSLIPITVNGFGTREITLVSLFGLFGITSQKVVSMSILSTIIAGILPGLLGMILQFYIKKGKQHKVSSK
jgi:uncharacterized protein (TIRG00374 family)